MATEPTLDEQLAQLKKQTQLLTGELELLKAQRTLDQEKQTREMQLATDRLNQELAQLKAQRTLDQEKQTQEMQLATDRLNQELAQLKAQRTLDQEKQTQDALTTKALLDALKDQALSQYALGTAQAQLPFAELQGIKAGISGLTLPSGKEGTVKVAAGTSGTSLLRSKQPMLELLDKVADDLITICSADTALLTEAQLGQVNAATFTLKQIDGEKSKLEAAIAKASPKVKGAAPGAAALPVAIAGAYTLGFTLDTINSLLKILRTNRQLDVFGADAEAVQMLGYLLESKGTKLIVNPAKVGNAAAQADLLMNKLKSLAVQLQAGNDTLAKIKKYSDDIAKARANDPIKEVEMPSEEDIRLLKVEVDGATVLLDSVNPSKNPDAFWAQVNGQLLAANIKDKQRLFVEVKAQTVQITESRWYASDRILATGEVQVAYRLLTVDGSLVKSGVILMASNTGKARIDELDKLEWQNTSKKQQ